ncbi:MAG: hypothetical protein JGK28_03605 [Microcoleus sp. PH2017_07_MST_O_A]|nr:MULTISPECIES: hypothetical protein [unclassified Microcoleus]MCC3417064.1 hypothetical protein [Microcoleus sp. PH2017_07_MST_O_A]MCC3456352.1 hypothetical protein [Microcoleus sp. PH2017_08_TRC_O_A]MCC3464760.1 hypothetical protein [Microcoleus sp. PH2017_06_SFM_O_A]MCC3567281.1 hypothetical protein [Microcoleus sp. PH2017_31_RDM_U_A]MCC3584465.1 hypothetical protein [Microcoleus sp. PH2017_30_WIL_O_A]
MGELLLEADCKLLALESAVALSRVGIGASCLALAASCFHWRSVLTHF